MAFWDLPEIEKNTCKDNQTLEENINITIVSIKILVVIVLIALAGLYSPDLSKCYFLQIHTKICSKVPIFYFNRPKRPPL